MTQPPMTNSVFFCFQVYLENLSVCICTENQKRSRRVPSPSHHAITRKPLHLSPCRQAFHKPSLTVWVPWGRIASPNPLWMRRGCFNGSERLAWQQMGVQLARLSLLELEAIHRPTATCPAGLMPPQHLAKPLHVMIRVQDGRHRNFLLHLSDHWRE